MIWDYIINWKLCELPKAIGIIITRKNLVQALLERLTLTLDVKVIRKPTCLKKKWACSMLYDLYQWNESSRSIIAQFMASVVKMEKQILLSFVHIIVPCKPKSYPVFSVRLGKRLMHCYYKLYLHTSTLVRM